MQLTKDEEARDLARKHYEVEAGLLQVFRIASHQAVEFRPEEPIKLLDVNEYSVPSGIMPIQFGPSPTSGVHYPSVILEVTPDEYERIRTGEMRLPKRSSRSSAGRLTEVCLPIDLWAATRGHPQRRRLSADRPRRAGTDRSLASAARAGSVVACSLVGAQRRNGRAGRPGCDLHHRVSTAPAGIRGSTYVRLSSLTVLIFGAVRLAKSFPQRLAPLTG